MCDLMSESKQQQLLQVRQPLPDSDSLLLTHDADAVAAPSSSPRDPLATAIHTTSSSLSSLVPLLPAPNFRASVSVSRLLDVLHWSSCAVSSAGRAWRCSEAETNERSLNILSQHGGSGAKEEVEGKERMEEEMMRARSEMEEMSARAAERQTTLAAASAGMQHADSDGQEEAGKEDKDEEIDVISEWATSEQRMLLQSAAAAAAAKSAAEEMQREEAE